MGLPGETPTVSLGAKAEGGGVLRVDLSAEMPGNGLHTGDRWPGVAVYLTSWAGERSAAMATASYREITEETAETIHSACIGHGDGGNGAKRTIGNHPRLEKAVEVGRVRKVAQRMEKAQP